VGNVPQKRRYTETPVQQVITMDTGHGPFRNAYPAGAAGESV
jgi:hypothetical protein